MDINFELPCDKDRMVTGCYFSNFPKLKIGCDERKNNIKYYSSTIDENDENISMESIHVCKSSHLNSPILVKKSPEIDKEEDDSLDKYVKLAFSDNNNDLFIDTANQEASFNESSIPFESIFDEKPPFKDEDSFVNESQSDYKELTATNNLFNQNDMAMHNNTNSMSYKYLTSSNSESDKIFDKDGTNIPSMDLNDIHFDLNQVKDFFSAENNNSKYPHCPKEVEGFARRRSTIGVRLNKQNYESMPNIPISLNKKKSLSLISLTGKTSGKKTNYGHVESKVKKYIENIKQNNIKKTVVLPQSRSLPTTPSRFSFQTTEKKIQQNFTQNDSDLYDRIIANLNDSSIIKPLIESLFHNLKAEKQHCHEQDKTLKVLQSNYEALHIKYAQAKDVIDKLRIYKGTQTTDNCYASSKNSSVSLQSGFSKLLDNWNSPMKKSLSTSNILYLEDLHRIDGPKKSNLVEYVSSPNIDKSELIDRAQRTSQENHCFKNPNELMILGSHCRISVNEWLEKSKILADTIKDYEMLEENSALYDTDRKILWKHIQENFELLQNHCPSRFDAYQTKDKLYQMEKTLECLSKTYHQTTQTSVLNSNQPQSQNIAHSKTTIGNPNAVPPTIMHSYDDEMSRELEITSLNQVQGEFSNADVEPSDCSQPEVRKFNVDGNSFLDDSLIPNAKIEFPFSNYCITVTKKSKGKDIDSGCPISDRSMKNEQNFIPDKTSYLLSKQNIYAGGQDDNYVECNPVSDVDYNSSSSSDAKLSLRNKKFTKKRVISKKPATVVNAYETRFPKTVSNQSLEDNLRKRSNYRLSEPLISQFEKHSCVFKEQMKDLKAREIDRYQQYTGILSPNVTTRPPNPVKPLRSHVLTSSPKSYYERRTEKEPDYPRSHNLQRLSPKERNRFVPRYSQPNEKQRLSFGSSSNLKEKFVSSDSFKQKLKKFPKATSMTALNESCDHNSSQPFIYIQDYNNHCQSPKRSCFCATAFDDRHSLVCHSHMRSFDPLYATNDIPRIMNRLEESSLLAQQLKHRSQSLINVLKK